MMNSSTDSVKARSAAATTPGRMTGRTTLKKVRTEPAPRSADASTSAKSKCRRRGRATTRLFQEAERILGEAASAAYHFNEKPVHTVGRPASLKLRSTTTPIGT